MFWTNSYCPLPPKKFQIGFQITFVFSIDFSEMFQIMGHYKQLSENTEFSDKVHWSKLDSFIPSWARKLPDSLESALKNFKNLEDGRIL